MSFTTEIFGARGHVGALQQCARLEGKSVRLAQAGQLVRHAVLRHAVSEAGLNEALRQRGLDNLDHAREVTLEPSGNISVLKAS